jgi:hypothetical protein
VVALVVVALALDVAVAVDAGLPVVEPLPPDDGEGVLDATPEAVPVVVTCGLGVETDGTDEEGDPPPVQAATVTASRAAPAATRAARSNAGRVTSGRVSAGGVPSGRTGAGRIATGTVRRTFMKPPRMTGGQWRRSTHLSMCHPNRQRKSERSNNSPPFRPTGIIPGAGG